MFEKIKGALNDEELIKRVQKEIIIIGEENLKDLITIKKILKDNFTNYSFSGSINRFYIAYHLGITKFNPVDYDIDYCNKFSVSINIGDGKKDELFNLIKRTFPTAKKVSNTSLENNVDYSGIVLDKNNQLSTYKTGIIKTKKKDIINNYLVINIYEKKILNLLNDMSFGNEELSCIFYQPEIEELLKHLDYNLKDHTAFEEIVKDIKDFNLYQLIHSHICFEFDHLDQIELEYQFTYYKYYQPRMYYIVYLQYLSSKVDVKVVSKYQNDFATFFKEHNDCFNMEYKFYALWCDSLQYISDLTITLIDEKIVINYENIADIYPKSIEDKFKFINSIIDKHQNKEIDIFGYEGNTEYYLGNLIASRLDLIWIQITSIVNPLGGDKLFFDYDLYSQVPVEKILGVINYFRSIPTYLHAQNYTMEELLNCTNSGTEIIIIDDYESFKDIDLTTLNKLNKKIYIFHRTKRSDNNGKNRIMC